MISVSSVSLSKTSITIKEGSSESLSATVSPSDAQNKAVSWSSSNSSVATVDNSGRVTGVKAGSATITVTTSDGGKTATCSVTVEPVLVSSLTMASDPISLAENDNRQLSAAVNENATDKGIIWHSSNDTVATVSADGMVTAVSAGTATITAEATVNGKRIAEEIDDLYELLNLYRSSGVLLRKSTPENPENVHF